MTTPDGVFMVPGLQPASPVTSLVGRLYDKVVTLVPLNEFSRPTTERTNVKLFRVPQEREQNWFPDNGLSRWIYLPLNRAPIILSS